MSINESALIIQRHERARQGRLRAKYMREIREQEEAEINPIQFKRDLPNPKEAAIRIQKVSIMQLFYYLHHFSLYMAYRILFYDLYCVMMPCVDRVLRRNRIILHFLKTWRGYLARQYTKRMRQDEFIWLGMVSQCNDKTKRKPKFFIFVQFKGTHGFAL